jgi:hypothetical protein
MSCKAFKKNREQCSLPATFDDGDVGPTPNRTPKRVDRVNDGGGVTAL